MWSSNNSPPEKKDTSLPTQWQWKYFCWHPSFSYLCPWPLRLTNVSSSWPLLEMAILDSMPKRSISWYLLSALGLLRCSWLPWMQGEDVIPASWYHSYFSFFNFSQVEFQNLLPVLDCSRKILDSGSFRATQSTFLCHLRLRRGANDLSESSFSSLFHCRFIIESIARTYICTCCLKLPAYRGSSERWWFAVQIWFWEVSVE